jgi:hypothetical protein
MTKYKVIVSQVWEAQPIIEAESREQAEAFALEFLSERLSLFEPDEPMEVQMVIPETSRLFGPKP